MLILYCFDYLKKKKEKRKEKQLLCFVDVLMCCNSKANVSAIPMSDCRIVAERAICLCHCSSYAWNSLLLLLESSRTESIFKPMLKNVFFISLTA